MSNMPKIITTAILVLGVSLGFVKPLVAQDIYKGCRVGTVCNGNIYNQFGGTYILAGYCEDGGPTRVNPSSLVCSTPNFALKCEKMVQKTGYAQCKCDNTNSGSSYHIKYNIDCSNAGSE